MIHTTKPLASVVPKPVFKASVETCCPKCAVPLADFDPNFCRACGYALNQPLLPEEAELTTQTPRIGAVVGGRYRLLGKIGSGGMGSVHKVEHIRMGKVMAMKVLHADLSRNERMVRRFNHEARAVSRLSSRHTVQVFDYGHTEAGLVYLVMEYLRGHDLGALLRKEGALPLDKIASIVRQIAHSLTEAHDQGIIHRDLKPENIFVCLSSLGEEIKVLDFGLAKLLEHEDHSPSLHGTTVGTPYYMSPEQICGEGVTCTSDVYSLGALIFHLATGAPPYSSKSALTILSSHLNDTLPLMSRRQPERAALLRPLEPIVEKAMSKEPHERYATVCDLANALDALVESLKDDPWPPTDAVPDHVSEVSSPKIKPQTSKAAREECDRYERWLKIRRATTWMACIALLAGVLAAGYWAKTGYLPNYGVESEPNNRTGEADPLFSEHAVEAAIGLPTGEEHSDVDFFEIRHNGEPNSSVDVVVSGVEGLDLVVDAFDASGRRVAHVNDTRAGSGETLEGLHWKGGPLFVAVREFWVEGMPARSAPEKPYTIHVVSRATSAQP